MVLLTDDEREIYILIKEFLKKKSFITITEILDFLNYRLGYNSNLNRIKIEIIIKNLIKKKYIFPNTKLVRDNILEVPLRKEIYQHIKRNPGININEIKRAFNIGSNQVLWHLKFLDKFQFIRFMKIQNQTAFFKFELDISNDKTYFYLRKKNVKKIIKLLENEREALSSTKISEKLKIHYNTTKKYLEVLSNLNLIIIVKKDDNDYNYFSLNYKNYYTILETLFKT